ncbi:MAG: PAS domain S-box protein [Desulfomonilaceae bacterium]
MKSLQTGLFTEVVEQMAEGVAFVDLKGRVLFSNRFLAAMHGLTAKELVGKHIAVLYPIEGLLNLAAANEETLSSGAFSGELQHRRTDGTPFPVYCTSSLFRDAQGRAVGIIMTFRDISALKISEKVASYSQEKTSQYVDGLEKQLRKALDQLGDSQSELKDYTTRLEQANEALKLFMREIENRNKERERAIYRNLSTKVFAIIDQLKSERLPDAVHLLLDSLEYNLKSLFSPPPETPPQELGLLTPQETRLCELIRAGLASKQIADVMGISPATVVVHRANIRKKLGLVGTDDNLATYLRTRL